MGDRERVNILLVDDDPAKLLSYEAILGELGEHLITANSGREALTHLLHTEIAVIVLDVHMPEMDGFTLAQAEEAEQGMHEQDVGERVVCWLAALPRARCRRVVGADAAPLRPVVGTRGEAGATAGTTTTGA